MIRFVDLTSSYWLEENDPENKPICAFVSTVDNCFVTNSDGQQTFSDMEDLDLIENVKLRERCGRLIPLDFFKGQ